MTDTVLMIAYHFPPSAEVSGALRTLAMARYLDECGVNVVVLSPHPRAYPQTDRSTLGMVPERCRVERTFALDVRRHLGVRGQYPLWLAQPDRWSSWILSAVPNGLRLIKQYKPRAIWSTYPITTSHLIASILHRRSGIPWIADFRDPMSTPVGQERSLTARTRAWVERRTIREANACVFVTEGARNLYEGRYAEDEHGPFAVIPNGFDDEAFADIPTTESGGREVAGETIVLVHSGLLYPRGRNPEPFFRAVSELLRSGRLGVGDLRVVLRASGSDDVFAPLVTRYGLGAVVELAPPVSRREALAEQCAADGLLLFQGREFNSQVPAKIYEYFRVGKPILGLVDEKGDTARLIASEQAGLIADIDDSVAIAERLMEFVEAVRAGRFVPLRGDALMKYSRRAGAAQLLRLMDDIGA